MGARVHRLVGMAERVWAFDVSLGALALVLLIGQLFPVIYIGRLVARFDVGRGAPPDR